MGSAIDERCCDFVSDNASCVHPDVLRAVTEANVGSALAYGGDRWSAAAEELLRERFGLHAHPFLVLTGTGANVLCLEAMTRAHEAVVCAAGAHVDVSECGALEALAGRKLLSVPTPDGKLTPALIEPLLHRRGDPHAVQPRVVSITQVTEIGTCYAADELERLCTWAHERELLVHVDGARLANAAAHLGSSLAAITTEVGVDAVSFGAAKNGGLLGEAIVLLRPELADGVASLRKQASQLGSKLRFVGAQVTALLADDLWRRNAEHANAMARRLADAFAAMPEIELTQRVESNAVFVTMPERAIETLSRRYLVAVWKPRCREVRWMCSWSTTGDDVDRLAADVADALGG